MVRTWSGHNEIVNGEAHPTWHNSCVGSERWLALWNLPGACLQSREWNHNHRETFWWSICVSWCLLHFLSCTRFLLFFFSQNLFFYRFLLYFSILAGGFLVNTKSSTPVAWAIFFFLPTRTNPTLTDTHTGKYTSYNCDVNNQGNTKTVFFNHPHNGGEAAHNIH